MGGFFHNNTNVDITFDDGNRIGFTGVNNFIWAHFDNDGSLYMFENNLQEYYITSVVGEDYYRLSTEEEIAQYDAAEEGEKPSNIRTAPIRMILDDDADAGYKIEPLGYQKWTNADAVDGEDSTYS